MTSKPTNKFAPGVRERAVLMVFDHERNPPSRWATVVSIVKMAERRQLKEVRQSK